MHPQSCITCKCHRTNHASDLGVIFSNVCCKTSFAVEGFVTMNTPVILVTFKIMHGYFFHVKTKSIFILKKIGAQRAWNSLFGVIWQWLVVVWWLVSFQWLVVGEEPRSWYFWICNTISLIDSVSRRTVLFRFLKNKENVNNKENVKNKENVNNLISVSLGKEQKTLPLFFRLG